MIKVNKLMVDYIKYRHDKFIMRRREKYPPLGLYKQRLNVPYMDDNNFFHQFDIFYAKEEVKKNILLIDVHGGSYIFGDRIDNYPFVYKFVEKGYDAITIDYIPNDGEMESKNLVDDCANALTYIFIHLKELELDKDEIVITGDSAGGHLALTLAFAIEDEAYMKELGYDFKGHKIKALLVNSPVYDVTNAGKTGMTKKGRKRLYGPSIYDDEKMRLISPRDHLTSLDVPLFLSTCKRDFLRSESLLLNEDMKNYDKVKYQFVDLDTNKKGVEHVHNVISPDLEESIKVNDMMMAFIEETLKK